MLMLDRLRAKYAELYQSKRDAAQKVIDDLAATLNTEERDAADDETEAYRAALATIEAVDADTGDAAEMRTEIARLEKIAERAAAAATAPTFIRKPDTLDAPDVREVAYLRPQEARDKALAMLDDADITSHLHDHTRSRTVGGQVVTAEVRSDEIKAHVESLIRTQTKNLNGSLVARRLLATESAEYRSAFRKLVTSPVPVLTPDEARAVQAFEEMRAMSIGTDASGGFGVPVLIDPTIILTAQGSLNPFRRISRVETITNDEWKGVTSAGVTWSYDAEAAAVSDDSPTLAQPNVVAHMARGFIPYSIEVGGDYPGFASEMSSLLMEGYDELQASAFSTGTGSGQPFGILTALDANTNVEVVVTTDGAFGGVDINKVWGALPDRYKSNATWVMNHDVGNEVATFGNGNNLSFVTVDLTDIVSTIRTRPVEYASYFPDFTATTGAANILVVGDFRNYLIAERAGMSVELVPHLFDVTNNRPTGSRGWFAWARHGADSINDLGFRLLQNQ